MRIQPAAVPAPGPVRDAAVHRRGALSGPARPPRFPAMAQTKTAGPRTRTLHFEKKNILLLAAGLAAITLGYWMLAGGSTVAAPLLLVLGYVVLIPLGIIL